MALYRGNKKDEKAPPRNRLIAIILETAKSATTVAPILHCVKNRVRRDFGKIK
jgi:hypothetical protein